MFVGKYEDLKCAVAMLKSIHFDNAGVATPSVAVREIADAPASAASITGGGLVKLVRWSTSVVDRGPDDGAAAAGRIDLATFAFNCTLHVILVSCEELRARS